MSDDYKNGYRDGFKDGYLAGFHAARDNDTLMSPTIPIPTTCKMCGIRLDTATGFVCPHPTCPSQFKVT